MNRKQLTLVILLGVVLGGIGFYLKSRDASTWTSSGAGLGQKLLADFEVNDVAHIRIVQGTNELNLVRKDDLWRVKERWDYPANFETISEFLRKAWEMKAVRTMQVGQSQWGRLELLKPGEGDKAGTLVELKDKDGKVLSSLILGKKHLRESSGGGEGWPDGRYVMVASNPGTVSLISETWSHIEPKPESWLNKDFFKCEKIKSVSLNWTNAWTLERAQEGGTLRLVDAQPGEELDTFKASSIGSVFSWPSFEDIAAPDAKPEDLGLDHPILATITTFDNFTYNFKIGNKPVDDDYYLSFTVKANLPTERQPGQDEKPEDKERLDKEFKEKNDKLRDKLAKEKQLEGWTFRVSKWTVDSLLKDRPQLMTEKKESDATQHGQSTETKPTDSEATSPGPVESEDGGLILDPLQVEDESAPQ